MAAPLTARQAEVLSYIARYASEHGFPPSGRELADACGMGSPSGAHRMVVLLEAKGYLTRTEGLSRGLSVVSPRVTVPNGFEQHDLLALRAMASWMPAARDAELTMAARVEDLEAKSALIETARERQEHVCSMQTALCSDGIGVATLTRVRHPAFVVQDGIIYVQNEFVHTLPRCEDWSTFVIDELICNRVSWRMSESISRARPVMRGPLWRHARLAERALNRAEHWAHELFESASGDRERDCFSAQAKKVAEDLYETARMLDASCDGAQLSEGIDPDEVAALV